MNQPDLGITIADLRTQKGLTQEKLAEYCDISKRTIQRIESGEVQPRAFTLNNLSNILEFDFNEENTNNETMWLTALHLSSAVCIVFIPLWIWSRKKKQSNKINQHGRHVLNFQITITLMLFAAMFFMFVLANGVFFFEEIGRGISDLFFTSLTFAVSFPFFLLWMFAVYQAAINAARALADKPIRYRLSLPILAL